MYFPFSGNSFGCSPYKYLNGSVSHCALLDALFRRRVVHDAVNINARQMDIVWG